MSTVIETRLNGYGPENGANGHNGTNGLNGIEMNEDGRWEEKFLPPPLRIDDKIRAQKVRHLLTNTIYYILFCCKLTKKLRWDALTCNQILIKTYL